MYFITIHDAIGRYLAGYPTARNLAPLTRTNDASDLKHLSRDLTERIGLATIGRVRPRHLDGYLSALDEKGLKGSSRRRKIATIRPLFGFLPRPVKPAPGWDTHPDTESRTGRTHGGRTRGQMLTFVDAGGARASGNTLG